MKNIFGFSAKGLFVVFFLATVVFIFPNNVYGAVIADSHFNALDEYATGGWKCYANYWNANCASGCTPEIVNNASTPDPSTALKVNYNTVLKDGFPPMYCSSPNFVSDDIYGQMYIYVPSNYNWHPIANKLSYTYLQKVSNDNPGNFFLGIFGANHQLGVGTQPGSESKAYGAVNKTYYGPAISTGVWHLIGWHMRLNSGPTSNGIIELWLDGNLSFKDATANLRGTTGSPWANRQFYDTDFQPIWGGIKNIYKPYADYFYIDRLILSTTPIDGSGGGGGVGCTSNWQCSGWGACSNGQQTQTCTDSNNCGTTSGKPATTQSCATPTPTPTPTSSGCTTLNFVSGSVSPTSVNPGGAYTMQCNYGLQVDSVTPLPGSGACIWTDWIPGTTIANFNCTAGTTLGIFTNKCSLRTTNSTSNTCARQDTISSTTITSTSPTPTPTQTPPAGGTLCHLLTSQTAVPAGYGASYNVLSTAKELLMSVLCDTTSATITIGNNSNYQYIYNKGYIYRGGAWQQVSYSCSNLVSSAWCVGNANATINLTTTELSNVNYILGYVCTWSGTQWQCGCRDNTCSTNYWNLQEFKYGTTPTPTPTPTPNPSNTITIRARGAAGGETIDLWINGATRGTWTLSTTYQDYSISSVISGSDIVSVYFINDAGDRDVQIDYAIINGTTYQAENMPINTGGWNYNAGGCGGAQGEWLHCNGYIQFQGSAPTPTPTPTPNPTPTPTPTGTQNNPPTGWFDGADAIRAVGWVYDKDQGTNPTNIQILIDGVLKTTIPANTSRPDLVTAGVAPNAEHGFDYAFSGLTSGTHTIRINTIDYPSGTVAQLAGSPLTITVGGSPTPTPTPTSGGGWTLNWADEFDYTGPPDPAKWGYETGFRPQWSDISYYGYRTWYSDARWENSRVENGNLVIEARADGFNGYNISTSCVSSRQTKQFLNGKIEIRAKMPTMVNATDNALWFVGSGSTDWPAEGEIDLLEYTPAAAWGGVSGLTHGNTAFHTLTAGNETQTFNYLPTISTEYHIYSVEWDQSIVRLFYDGAEVNSYPNNGSNDWPFNHSIFLYMNIEPGDWAGGAAVQYLDISRFPVTMYVDYVRYYIKN